MGDIDRQCAKEVRVNLTREILQQALQEAGRLNLAVIARHQAVRELAVVVNNGRTERVMTEESRGLGVQVFTAEGYSGFASGDNPSGEMGRELVGKAAQLAELSKRFGGEKNQEVFSAPQSVANPVSPERYSFDHLGIEALEHLVQGENRYILEQFTGVSVQTSYRQLEEEWSIVRTGGSEAFFVMPRAVLAHTLTARSPDGKCVTTRSAYGGADMGLLLERRNLEEGRARTLKMAQLASDLLTAPRAPGGHFKLVIDYALAKGLAHEAFGHAVETDSVKTSILGEGGKLKLGLEVADPQVSIVDGPLPGDWAYQPVSANAIPRQTVRIVDKGRLASGLGDLFSAASAGVPLSGAGRAESYAHIPLPRMTNIRIETENPIPLAKAWYEISPAELYRVLVDNGLAEEKEDIYYLAGYKGGQVNTQFGDFVFNCSAVYKLGENPVLCQPGIFAGKTLSALKAITTGIGPMVTDALGTCGKWGQGVSSSGGSHAFLVLRADPDITLGGE